MLFPIIKIKTEYGEQIVGTNSHDCLYIENNAIHYLDAQCMTGTQYPTESGMYFVGEDKEYSISCRPEIEFVTLEEIIKIAKENRVEKIVVGVPINMDGTQGFQAEDCINFSQKILGFDIIYEDERLTSEEAESRLRSRKIDFRKNKGLVDQESACVILEQYLSRGKLNG